MGPWGGSQGQPFDDGTFSGIREIKIGYHRWIHSISVVYDKDDKPTDPYIHGEDEGQLTWSEVSLIGCSNFFKYSDHYAEFYSYLID